jgi:hypothetical protein
MVQAIIRLRLRVTGRQATRLWKATFQANRVVDTRLALNPACSLAMLVYGNGLLKKQ